MGDVLAVCSDLDTTIDLFVVSLLTLRPVIAKPMGLMTHAGPADVVAVLGDPVPDAECRATPALLRACMEYRFRHDVGIGDATRAATVAADDIELGG